jgi:hypothetical protein
VAEDFARLTLTRRQQRLLDTSVAIRGGPPARIDFLHSIQCQCGIPYKNPGDGVLEWDRRQGNASLRIEAGSAIDPRTGDFVRLTASGPGHVSRRGTPSLAFCSPGLSSTASRSAGCTAASGCRA